MSANRLETDRYIGTITISDLLPNLFDVNEKSVLVYLDQSNRLMAYTQGFHHFFREHFAQPSGMLGLPAGRFIEPLPSAIQVELIRKIRTAPGAEWKESVSAAPRLPAGLTREKEGLVWNAAGQTDSILTFPAALEFDKIDMRLTLDFSTGNGFIPGLFLGDKEPVRGYYDREGYALTYHPGYRRMQLKKTGYILQEQILDLETPERIEFLRIGPYFQVLRNGTSVLNYFDMQPLDRMHFYATLFLRIGESCRLSKIRLETRPASRIPSIEEVVVSLKNRAGTQCLMDRVTGFSLTGRHSDLHAYRIRNISMFKDRILKLEQKVLRQQQEGRKLKGLLAGSMGGPTPLLGISRAIQQVREKAERVAASPSGVLIQGATGTGKEVLARHLHQLSERKDRPFVKVDCSTLPATLLESELFGHEKGAFTGAESARQGLFERAGGGTLFIDEINNLPIQAQSKLLQFLQDHTVTRIGGGAPISLDVRVLVASGIPLVELVRQGTFREDLYFRIAVITFEMPPLRERLEDLPDLCEYFLSLYGGTAGRNIESISAEAYRKMYGHSWPGNIRELRNVIEQAAVFCEGKEISASLIQFPERFMPEKIPGTHRKPRGLIQLSKEDLAALLTRHGGNIRQAALEIRVTPRALYYCLKRDGLTADQYKRRPRNKAG